jgi:hypothetical protein
MIYYCLSRNHKVYIVRVQYPDILTHGVSYKIRENYRSICKYINEQKPIWMIIGQKCANILCMHNIKAKNEYFNSIVPGGTR